MSEISEVVVSRSAGILRQGLPVVLAVAGCTVVLIMLAASWTHSRFANDAVSTVQANQARYARLERLLVLMLDEESGVRGYLVARNEQYLEPWRLAESKLDGLLAGLKQDFSADADDRQAFQRVEALIAVERGLLRDSVAAGHLVVPVSRSEVGADKAYMDSVRKAIAQLKGVQAENNEALAGQALNRLHAMKDSVTWLAVVALVLIVALFAVQQRQSRLRARLANLLREENEKLESTVARRTHELSELASYLTNAREAERGRLALELHDELGSLLTAAKMDAGWLQRSLAPQLAPDMRDRFRRLIDAIGSGILLKRRIIDDLRPPLLAGLGLVEALRAHCDTLAGDLRLEAELPEDDVDLPEAAALAIFRIAQEALTNVRKYAAASRVRLGLACRDGQIHLWVDDDGVGFDPTSPKLGHHGLAGMRHRVQMLAGRLSIRSAPGEGTRIDMRCPLPRA